MSEEELNATYFRLVQGAYHSKKISKTCYENLMDRYGHDLDQIDRNSRDLVHAIEHGEYYITLDRIEKGEEKIRKEANELKKSEYRKLLNELMAELETLTPREEAA